MKKFLIVLLLALVFVPISIFAGDVTSTSSSGAVAGSASKSSVTANPVAGANLNLTQEGTNIPAGQGRWFIPPVQPYQAPIMPYLGPWSTGYNILEDLRVLPETLTKVEALKMYQGGVSARISKMADFSYQFETCKLMNSLPMRPLLATDKNPVLDKDGKPILVPDEAKFKRVAFIFLKGDKSATTIDVISKAVIEAMEMGATGIYLVKKVTSTSTSSFGWGIGLGAVSGTLSGSEKDRSSAFSAGTGINKATAEPVYQEGMIVLAIQE